jgi:hypothetical protein
MSEQMQRSKPVSPVPGGVTASPASQASPASRMFTELKASAHLMTLETGLFCIMQTPGARRSGDGTWLPGVRVSLLPHPASRPQAVSIASFRPDGYLTGPADAALVRVNEGPAQILVTIYQEAHSTPDQAPRLQVLRLSEDMPQGGMAVRAPQAPLPSAPPPAAGPQIIAQPAQSGFEVVAHMQIRGDVGAMLGEWVGERGSRRWIEGFVIAPRGEVGPADIEYQGVLGRGWLSPWISGGQLCGSRGMALPLLGLRVRLKGKAAETHRVLYEASFIDGSVVGPVVDGEACEAENPTPLEAFRVVIEPRSRASRTPAAASSPLPAARASAPAEKGKAERGRKAKAEPAKSSSARGETKAKR